MSVEVEAQIRALRAAGWNSVEIQWNATHGRWEVSVSVVVEDPVNAGPDDVEYVPRVLTGLGVYCGETLTDALDDALECVSLAPSDPVEA